MASLLRTAEELRIKGLAEVSWNDDNGDGKRHKPNTSQGSRAPNHLYGFNETAITAHKPHNQTKRHSISTNPMNADIDPLSDAGNSMSRESDENSTPMRPTAVINHHHHNHHSVFSNISPSREEPMPPVKKKRGISMVLSLQILILVER